MYNNRRLALSIFWVLLGVTLVGLSVAGMLDDSLYAGMGGALAAIGALQIMRNIRYRSDSEYRQKVDIEINDERNKYLRMKSWSWAGYIAILVEGIGAVVAMVLGHSALQQTLSYSVCLILTAYWVTYLVLSRKY